MHKRVLRTIGIVVLISVFFVQALAIEPRVESAKPSLSFDGTTAVCSALCKGNRTSDDIEVTLTIYQGRSYVDSWNDSGTGSVFLEGKCPATSGKSYKLTLEYSVNGKKMPSVSVTGVCP